ncbi:MULTISPECIES: hypothetical protein [Mesorhizobium]|uniref:hypothetical protein n=1 Tax=Mesorhizobium TaxID=68287 RepID=UPI0012E32A13|nr:MULTISPECIES: hypothetical protein [Mesorhizobium]MUT27112.1 hypothetical protein [Mesorhizobium japonicum]
MNRDHRLTFARRNRTLIHETGMGRESQSSFLSFAKGKSALMIEFHQFHASPVDDIERRMSAPASPRSDADGRGHQRNQLLAKLAQWRGDRHRAMSSASRDSGVVSFTIPTRS